MKLWRETCFRDDTLRQVSKLDLRKSWESLTAKRSNDRPAKNSKARQPYVLLCRYYGNHPPNFFFLDK